MKLNSTIVGFGRLLSHIYTQCDPCFFAPVVDKPVNVNVNINMGHIINVNEPMYYLDSSFDFSFNWTNPDISWNPDDYDGIESMDLNTDSSNKMSTKLFWSPTLSIGNSVEESMKWNKPNTPLFVYSDGSMTWYNPWQIKSQCYLDLTHFPFDIHTCYINIVSHVETIDAINFSKVTIQHDDCSNAEWNCLIDTKNITHHQITDVFGQIYPTFTISLTIKRNPKVYSTVIIVPVILISLLIMISTVIVPWGSGTKLGTTMTLLLTLVVYIMYLSELIPKSSILPNILNSITFFFIYGCSCVLYIILLMWIKQIIKEYNSLYNEYKSIDDGNESFSFLEQETMITKLTCKFLMFTSKYISVSFFNVCLGFVETVLDLIVTITYFFLLYNITHI